MWHILLRSFAEVLEVIQVEETGQVSGVTLVATESGQAFEVTSATEMGGDPIVVVEFVTC
jgi:hypothetical protein